MTQCYVFTVPHSGTRSLIRVLRGYFYRLRVHHLIDARRTQLAAAIAAGGPIATTSRPLHLVELGWRKRGGGELGHRGTLPENLANLVKLYRECAAAGIALHVFPFGFAGAELERNAALARLLELEAVDVAWPDIGHVELA